MNKIGYEATQVMKGWTVEVVKYANHAFWQDTSTKMWELT